MQTASETRAPWGDVFGQPEAVEILRGALRDRSQMTHAWLITGPPGSGRSTLAYAFAAALIADLPDESSGYSVEADDVMSQVHSLTHPDLTALRTEGTIIPVEQVRQVAARSYLAPGSGRHRVIVIEDADRMTERTSNVILKALEEPPEKTVWILCAPSEVDLLPTIKSRVRTLRLREVDVEDVARLIVKRTGVDLTVAEQAARHAQRHVGMAQRLATDPASRERRGETLRSVLDMRSVRDVVMVAARIVQIAGDDAKALTQERDEAERAALLRTVGLAEGAAIPPAVRSSLSALEDEQKRRAKRSLTDGLDRVLTDLQSLYRDVLMLQFGRHDGLINAELLSDLSALSTQWNAARTLNVLDEVARIRRSLSHNIAPLLAVESLLVTIQSGRTP